MNFKESSPLLAEATSPQRIKKTLLRLALLALFGAMPAFAKYGDTLEVQGGSELPMGWVVIAVRGPISMATVASTPEQRLAGQTLTIKDLYRAPYGARETVMACSPIPPGWVILRTRTPNAFSAASTVRDIQCLIEPPPDPAPAPAPAH